MNVAIVTLLFTDLVGSSEMLDRLGDDGADALRRTHFRLLREAVSGYGGEEVKNLGDGLMVAFPSAMDAISCAIAMQQAVTRHNEEHPDMPIVVRIGLHAGEPVQEDNDYFGRAVVIASRICDKAEGGQIVSSELVENIVGGRGGFVFRDIGPLDLKGIASPVPAREVVWGRETSLPPPVLAADVVDRSKARAAQPALVGLARAPRGVRVALALLTLILAVVAGAVLSGKGYLFGDDETPSPMRSPGPEIAWFPVEPISAGFGGPGTQRIHRIATNESELVAVGFDTSLGDSDAAVWRSDDGQIWRRDHSDALRGRGGQLMWGVAFDDQDRVIAVGYDGSGPDLDAAVWIDAGDGWDQVTAPALGGPQQQVMNRIASGPLGVVAGGYSTEGGSKDGAVWTSTDGTDWKRVDDVDTFGGPGDQEIRGVAMNESVIVLVGSDGTAADANAAVWVSNDGSNWTRIPGDRYDFGGPQGQVMTAAEALDGRGFVAVGWDEGGRTREAAAWTSPDGFVWDRAPSDEAVLGGPGKQEMYAVNPFGDRLVAVGADSVGGGFDAAVWISDDGITWQRLDIDEDIMGGERGQAMRWVIGFQGFLVGAGWTEEPTSPDSDAVIWYTDSPEQN